MLEELSSDMVGLMTTQKTCQSKLLNCGYGGAMAVWRGGFSPKRHTPSALWRFMADSAIPEIAAATTMAPWRSMAVVAELRPGTIIFKGIFVFLQVSPARFRFF